MLVLFDIDGTLLSTGCAGREAVAEACLELFGREVRPSDQEMPGNLDPLIWRRLCEVNGVEDHEALHPRFRELYAANLERRLVAQPTTRVFPGARELIGALLCLDQLTLGVLTGNYPETGRAKLRHAGLDPELFPVAAWGDDGETRRALPPVAMRRYAELRGESLAPQRVVVIGDTPHDVDCAQASGCRSLAVATGHYAADSLVSAGADRVVDDLTATASLVEWITGG